MYIAYLILIVAIINILHIGVFMIGSDIYSVIEAKRNKRLKLSKIKLPKFSVLIPAHNEEETILHCVQSVLDNDYPRELLQILVINDGSTDETLKLLKKLKKANPDFNLDIITQKNAGKAHALNNGIAKHATGDLVMCLDADSSIAPNAIRESINYFDDKKVVAMAANIKIRPSKSLLNSIQTYEYIMGHRQKRAQSFLNIEYVIGGVGSVFRRDKLEQVNFYDTDTLTEDLDLTLKLVSQGSKEWRVVFGANVLAYTESVLTVKDLLKQRFRWKLGFFQSLIKNKSLIFSTDKKHNPLFTWIWLPYMLFSMAIFLINPILITYIFYHMAINHDIVSLSFGILFVSIYMISNILMETTIDLKDRFKLAALAPSMYFFFYIIIFVEYIAIIKSFISLIFPQDKARSGNVWEHVKREKLA